MTTTTTTMTTTTTARLAAAAAQGTVVAATTSALVLAHRRWRRMKVLAMIETGTGEVDLAVQAAAVHETTEATASASRTMFTSWVMLVPPRASLTMRLSLVEGVVDNKKARRQC